MGMMSSISEAEFIEIDAAMRASEKGRLFLAMTAERSQSISVSSLRQMLHQTYQEHLGELVFTAEQTQIQILRQELQEMSSYILQTRNEIAALRPSEGSQNRIIAATGELDAIVSATERATSSILNSAERVLAAIEKIPASPGIADARAEIQNEATEILMACSFQDITGQRTTKVVNTLRYLEQRVNAMLEIWGSGDAKAAAKVKEAEDSRPDAHLLNGPALEGGVSQDDVDALLAGIEPALASAPEPAAANMNAPDKAPRVAVVAPPAAPPRAAAAEPPPSTGNDAVSSQDEIDALFA